MISPGSSGASNADAVDDEPVPGLKGLVPETDENDLSPPSLEFPMTKHEEVQFNSPTTTAFLEALLSDEVTDCDFMLCSPLRKSPLSLQQNLSHEHSDALGMKGKSVATGYMPSRFSPEMGSSSGVQRLDRGPSPLYKVFLSPEYQELLADCNLKYDGEGDRFGLGSHASACDFDLSANAKASLEMPNATRLHTLIDVDVAAKQSCLSLDNSIYLPMTASMAAPVATFSDQLKQDDHHQEQHQHHQLDKLLMSQPLPTSTDPQENDRGLQLVHLLLACAEAVSREDYMLGRRCLHELNQVSTPLGDAMQRVASCFMEALSERLAGSLSNNLMRQLPPFPPNSLEIHKIYQILYQACPYVKFAHFTANQAIFEAFQNEERVHVIDLDILQGYQWPSLMQALAAKPGGPPFLRITGVGTSLESVCETGRCLAELAHSMHIPFEFHPVGERLETLRPHMLNRRVGEALAVNSVNRLHRVPAICLGNLLTMIGEQAPIIVTLVEQEASHNRTHFLSRFLEALHYYSAIFDSLEATFPPNSMQRAKVEQYIFAPEIKNIVACEGPERIERHEQLDRWRMLMEGRGFRGVPLGENAVAQSKMLLDLYPCGGYQLTEDNGCLLLGWQDRALVAASAWQ
ncbi:hypothetical protein MLD38_024569 [Melastoma candidum]|uniref:Uncharacterized protein n=1 Tax=Melastoma candidum TaxID=119954 RepID=A0ACB9NTN9_9MYRT|nr:hypothetical protein MLD38_024569 [Melastoma candidum]